jgi:D-alanyl-D-alanine carboxypeptidase/D-alanyl-D-alanine-endopeptidase (penicillin-binding protein 4)
MYKTESVRAAFYDSLPIAGVDGDLRRRMAEPPTRGNVHAKTGYIGNVRSLSGYVNDAEGNLLVFSFMVNQNFAGISKADIPIEAACRLLAEFSETGDGGATGAK